MDEEGLRRWQTKTHYCVQRSHHREGSSISKLGQVPSAGFRIAKSAEASLVHRRDASYAELICLGSIWRLALLYPYDNGVHAKQILEGDIHTYNQKAAGLGHVAKPRRGYMQSPTAQVTVSSDRSPEVKRHSEEN